MTDAVAEARAYIMAFRRQALPSAKWVDANLRRIWLERMTDEEALFVAEEFRKMQAETERRALKR